MLRTVVVKLVEGKVLHDLAVLVDDIMLEGARPDAVREVELFAFNNTPTEYGWCRIPATAEFIEAMEFLLDQPTMQGILAEYVEHVEVEQDGQKERLIHESVEDGQVFLGYIDNAPVYVEPVEA